MQKSKKVLSPTLTSHHSTHSDIQITSIFYVFTFSLNHFIVIEATHIKSPSSTWKGRALAVESWGFLVIIALPEPYGHFHIIGVTMSNTPLSIFRTVFTIALCRVLHLAPLSFADGQSDFVVVRSGENPPRRPGKVPLRNYGYVVAATKDIFK